jgi:transcription termination factor Rho
MFEISVLKEMKLAELQEIAKAAKTIKFNGVKKDDLIQKIIETQNSASNSEKKSPTESASKTKPKERIVAPKDNKEQVSTLFSQPEIPAVEKPEVVIEVESKVETEQPNQDAKSNDRPAKFIKSKFEKKIFKKEK